MKRSQPTFQFFFNKQTTENRSNRNRNRGKYSYNRNIGQCKRRLIDDLRPCYSHDQENATNVDVVENDIGHGWKSVSDDIRLRLLRHTWVWVPPPKYAFSIIGNRKLKFQAKWMDTFNWLTYTKVNGEGAVCKYCVLYQHNHFVGKYAVQKTGTLVSKPFTNWKNALENFRDHQNASYHKEAVLFADDYIKTTTVKKKTFWTKSMTVGKQIGKPIETN